MQWTQNTHLSHWSTLGLVIIIPHAVSRPFLSFVVRLPLRCSWHPSGGFNQQCLSLVDRVESPRKLNPLRTEVPSLSLIIYLELILVTLLTCLGFTETAHNITRVMWQNVIKFRAPNAILCSSFTQMCVRVRTYCGDRPLQMGPTRVRVVSRALITKQRQKVTS